MSITLQQFEESTLVQYASVYGLVVKIHSKNCVSILWFDDMKISKWDVRGGEVARLLKKKMAAAMAHKS